MRVVTRLLCVVLAAMLVATGVVVLVGISLSLLTQSPWLVDAHPWLDGAATESWSSAGHRLLFLVVLGVGLFLLLVAWVPRRPVTLASSAGREVDGVVVTVRRRAVEDRVAARVRELPYVVDVSVRADTALDVVAATTRGDDPTIHAAVVAAVEGAVERFGLDPHAPEIKLRKSAGRAA